jgi:hypothetical protein
MSVMMNKAQSGAVKIDDFNSACAVANYEILNQRLGLPQNYTPQNPSSPISYQRTQKITDDLKQLITIVAITKNGSGYFPLPSDYYAFSSMEYRYVKNNDCGEGPDWEDINVEILADGEFNVRKRSKVIMPEPKYPVGNYYSYGVKVLPEVISRVKLTYVKTPQTPVWGFTLVNDQPVYESTTSTDFDYPVSMTNDIAMVVLAKLGLNLHMNEIVQYAEAKKVQGF